MISFNVHFRVLLGLIAAAVISMAATPAQAQLGPGCTCPAGFTVTGPNTCTFVYTTVAATCPGPTLNQSLVNPAFNQSVAHIAASQQQLSFSGVQSILQGRRDQLQGTLGGGKTTSMISGYSASELDEQTSGALGYAASQRSNPLASPIYKAPPAPAATSSGPSWSTWTQGLGDWEHDDPTAATDTGHFTNTYAAQAGIDGTWQGLAAKDDALVLGVVGSWISTHVSYDGTPTTTKMEGPGVGIYGTYVRGGFSTDLTTKFDFLRLTQDFADLTPPNTIDLTNAGLTGNMQYKQDLGNSTFVEPTGGFSFTRTMFGAGAVASGLTDADTLRLQAGARLGTTWSSNGVGIESSLKALVYSDVIAEGSAAATAAAVGIVPTDQGKVRGEVDPVMNLDFGNGVSTALSGSVRFGEGMIGGSANVNLRKQW